MAARTALIAVFVGVTSTLGIPVRADEPQPPALGRSVEIRLVENTEPATEKPKTPQYPKTVEEGTSASSVKKTALAALPVADLTPDQQARVKKILGHVSFFRRLPTLNFAVDPQVYAFFMQHPDAAVSIWRAMEISKVKLWQTGRTEYEADVGDGSTGVIEILQQTPTQALIICDGLYKSPLVKKPIETRSLVFLQSSFSKTPAGAIYVTHRADVFVSFPSQTIDMAAKIFSPLAVSMTDATFSEVSLFLKMMSVAMVRRPEWVEALVGKMDGVQELRKKQLVELTNQVHTRYAKRALEQAAAEMRAETQAIEAAAERTPMR